MCCSVTPGVQVRFSDTVLYAAEVKHPRDEEVAHVLGYQNRVQGRAGLFSWWPWGGVGNAMILPFPAVPGSMSRSNVIDTAGCPGILQDVADALPSDRLEDDDVQDDEDFGTLRRSPPKFQVFEAAGIYTVVLAENPRDIPDALDHVPKSKRPTLNPALFDAYARWYPGWTVALCCFNTRKARLADPLLWWYKPMQPDRLFLPALDCHTGDVPDLNADVRVDHVVAVSSYRLLRGHPVQYGEDVPEQVAPYFRPFVVGERYNRPLPNGDFVCRLDEIADGKFSAERQRPPGANPSTPQPRMNA